MTSTEKDDKLADLTARQVLVMIPRLMVVGFVTVVFASFVKGTGEWGGGIGDRLVLGLIGAAMFPVFAVAGWAVTALVVRAWRRSGY